MRLDVLSTALATALLSGVAHAAPPACASVPGNFVVNCGFEVNTAGWTLGGTNGVLFAVNLGLPGYGTRSGLLNFDSQGSASASQTFAAGTYDISFVVNFYNAGVSLPLGFSASFGAQELVNVTQWATSFSSPDQGYAGWTAYSFTGLTVTQPTALTFLSSAIPGRGVTQYSDVIIDNVIVTGQIAAVPEPGTVALLGAGLGALVLMRRRARSNARVSSSGPSPRRGESGSGQGPSNARAAPHAADRCPGHR